MFIRPTLLLLYETHFVPLRERLRPALSGFLSGVLPGLEIGSDHFDRTNSILENVCEGVGPEWFYTCIWQGIRSNSPVRLPAISYILAHYNRKLSMEDQLYLMGRDIDVMVMLILSIFILVILWVGHVSNTEESVGTKCVNSLIRFVY